MAAFAAGAHDGADQDAAWCDGVAVAAVLRWAHHACAVSAEDKFTNFAHPSGVPVRLASFRALVQESWGNVRVSAIGMFQMLLESKLCQSILSSGHVRKRC